MPPPAPPRFSITTGCPRAFDMRSPTMRPTMSALPPAAKGTIRRIGRSGYFAKAARGSSASVETAPRLAMTVRREVGIGFLVIRKEQTRRGQAYCRSSRKSEQAAGRVPEQLAAIAGIRKELSGQLNQRAVVLPLGRAQIRPVRCPQAVIERECVDQRLHEWPAVLERIRCSGEFQIAGHLDAHAPGFRQT